MVRVTDIPLHAGIPQGRAKCLRLQTTTNTRNSACKNSSQNLSCCAKPNKSKNIEKITSLKEWPAVVLPGPADPAGP